MKIYLHIGLEKTGSTAIQKFLWDSRPFLRGSGICYPDLDGRRNHTALTLYSMNSDRIDGLRRYNGLDESAKIPDFRKKIETKISDLVGNSECNSIVFSNEHCSSRLVSSKEISRLQSLLSKISTEVQVIMYLRNLEDLLISSYSETIKNGSTHSLDQYLKNFSTAYFHFDRIIQIWQNTFGQENVNIGLFDKKALFEQNLVADFLYRIDRDLQCPPQDSLKENLSLGRKNLELLRRLNAHLPLMNGNQINRARGDISYQLSIQSNQDKLLLTKEQQDHFYGKLVPIKEALSKICPEFVDELFKMKPTLGDQEDELNLEDATSIFASLWKAKQNQINLS